jgi:hypothetical protein
LELTAEDHIAIEQLYARYAFASDLNDMDSWLGTWSDDGEFTSFGGAAVARGRDALREMGAGFMASLKQFHWHSNLVLEPTDYGASGSCYLMLVDAPTGRLKFAVYYRDELVKQGGKWLFRRRRTIAL